MIVVGSSKNNHLTILNRNLSQISCLEQEPRLQFYPIRKENGWLKLQRPNWFIWYNCTGKLAAEINTKILILGFLGNGNRVFTFIGGFQTWTLPWILIGAACKSTLESLLVASKTWVGSAAVIAVITMKISAACCRNLDFTPSLPQK